MKIKTKRADYDKVMAMPRPDHHDPLRPNRILQTAIRVLSSLDMIPTHFCYQNHNMDRIGKKEPVLILMNHSSFIDLKIAHKIFYPKRFGIVCTSDGFVGKPWLMRLLGCIPTQKFVTDITLISDMEHLLKKKKCSVLLFPEASYSFDGTATALPRKFGVLLKKLGVSVVTVITQGAFARDPLYNGLQHRKVNVRADVTCLFTAEELKTKSVAEIDQAVDQAFSFDNFAWQRDNGVVIDEPFRADGLHRILYRCPHCGKEGATQGKGIALTCQSCGKAYELTELGQLKAADGEAAFTHVPDWYAWQREEVRKELADGTYRLDTPVEIGMMVNYKAIYMVGQGRLTHDENGFHLTGCDGCLDYSQGPLANYGLYADYYWYEIGDVICIGNRDALYYCFPKQDHPVAKTRIAAEELYKLKKRRPKQPEAAKML